MKYKHKEDIKRMLFDQHRVESDPSVLNTAFNMRDELDEVYRKAEAFDAVDDKLNELVELYRNKAFKEEMNGFKGPHDEYKEVADRIESIRTKGLKLAMDMEDSQ